MTPTERHSWERIRREGRDRFLLKRIAKVGWILVFAAIFEVCWWLVAGEASEPLRSMIAKWILLALVMGAWTAFDEWKTKEKEYHESESDSSGR
jgi:hypothetical protein